MRKAALDAVGLMLLCAALVVWRVHLDPSAGDPADAVDWRFRLVWMTPLAIVAYSPWILHPYVVGGRDLPQRRAPRRRGDDVGARLAPEGRAWAAARPRGAA